MHIRLSVALLRTPRAELSSHGTLAQCEEEERGEQRMIPLTPSLIVEATVPLLDQA